ncbi:LysR family transcriptional regulator, partial [Amnimonas aquatica]
MDTLDAMRVFVRVSDMGSFIRAAHALDLPRTTVSQAVQQLEQRLGVRLLQRTTRRVGLTSDGQRLLARCRRILAEMDALETLLPPDGELNGQVRLDVPSRIAHRVLMPRLPAFLRSHPRIELVLGARDRITDLVVEGIDCALRVGHLDSSSLVARPLGYFRQISCASPAYLAEHGVPAGPDDLAGHRMVGYASPQTGRVLPWEHVVAGSTTTLTLPCQVAVDNAEGYIGAALAGLGLIQVPYFDVEDLLGSGRLVEVLPQAGVPALPVALIFPHR